jgi:integral membrane protein
MEGMPEPRVASFPAIRGALKFYQIASIITGVMLLLLVTEMVLKYTPIHLELFLGGSGGPLWFAEVVETADGLESTGDGFNVSQGILVAHGWFYVVYLFACFRMWSMMRWPFVRFILLALGGVIPLLSFFMETRVARDVKAYLAHREAAEHPAAPATTTPEGAR